MIYLDNAATTLKKPEAVIEAMVNALHSFGNSGRGAHEETLSASRVIFDTRCRIAKLVNASRADHVIFTANSTEALNIALHGLIKPGDRVVSTDAEHNSVLRPLYRLREERGIELSFAPAEQSGLVRTEDILALIVPGVSLVVTTHASNLTGNMLDIERIGEAAHKAGALYVVDASQTMGAYPIDMEKMHIDVLCFTGHKSLMGPQGTGGLVIREGVEIRPFKVGGTGVKTFSETQPEEYPTRLEAGTMNAHGIAGLNAALRYIESVGIASIHEKEMQLTRRFYEGVKGIRGVTVYGDFSKRDRAPIVSLAVRNYDSAEVGDELSEDYGIATRPGGHCAPRLHRAMGTEERGLVRFSFGWYTTLKDVDAAIAAVRKIAEE